MTIHLIITGGTIDSHYDGRKDTIIPNEKSVIPSFLDGLKLYTDFEFTTICMKDSRNLTEADRKDICTAVENSSHKHIVVTHGTYTMPDTARYLRGYLTRKDQVIVITGSMIPLQGFLPSDAPFNIGFALAKLVHLSPGIHVAMNGRVFTPEEAVKLLEEGRFGSLFTD